MKNGLISIVLLIGTLFVSITNAQTTFDNILDLNLNDQTIYYISKNNVRVRSAPDTKSKVLGYLSLNDRVKIINPTLISKSNMVEIVIVETYDPIENSDKKYVSLDFLSLKIIDYKDFLGEYYIVVNVATETLRLYKRICPDNSCPNKMIMETEVVVGEDVDHPKEEKVKEEVS
jgi:hypothetical protein